MNRCINIACLALCGGAALPALAEGYAVGGTFGTDGVGIEYTYALSDSVTVSAGYSGINFNTTRKISAVSYQLDSKLRSLGFKASYFPSDSSFHVTLGAINNGTEFDAKARPVGDSFELNGNSYPASSVSSINGKLRFPSTTPYIGIGWGNPVRPETRWNFTFDMGFQYLKSVNASLNATCNNSLINQLQCFQLKNDVAQEEKQLQDDVNKNHWWPVLRAGAQYQF